MKRLARLILGVIAAGSSAGLVGATVLVLVTTQQLPESSDNGFERWVTGLFVFGIILTLYGLVAAVVIGLPVHLVLTWIKRTGWIFYVGVGLAAGLLVAVVFGGWAAFLASGAAAGAVGALVFWLIVRPDIKRPRTLT